VFELEGKSTLVEQLADLHFAKIYSYLHHQANKELRKDKKRKPRKEKWIKISAKEGRIVEENPQKSKIHFHSETKPN